MVGADKEASLWKASISFHLCFQQWVLLKPVFRFLSGMEGEEHAEGHKMEAQPLGTPSWESRSREHSTAAFL